MKNIKINGLLRVALGTVVMVAVLAVNGCIFGPDPRIGDDPDEGFTTPKGAAEMIEFAYNDTDIELYKKCLSPNFTFYFDPNNVGEDVEGYIIPDSWGYDLEVDAVGNMFDNADSIILTVNTTNIGEPGVNDEKFSAPNVAINLLVMVDSQNGLNAIGPVDFEFESYPNPEDPTQKLWRVKKWWDRTWKPS